MAGSEPSHSIRGKSVMILGTSPMSLYQHRLELIKTLLNQGAKVIVVAPDGEEVPLIRNLGCSFVEADIEGRGTNPFHDFSLLKHLISIIRRLRPDVVLTFYTKTNIYGGIACQITKTPYIENITGLGSALTGGGLRQKLMIGLYGFAVRRAREVFFQNKTNIEFFRSHSMWNKSYTMLPGSGVALDRHKKLPYPQDSVIRFLYVGRVLPQKGIFDFIEASDIIKKKNYNVEIHVVGPAKDDNLTRIRRFSEDGKIIYHGKVIDVRPIMKDMHCLVYPSYYAEGMANVLLESAAAGRPIITTDCPGCGETIDDNITGFIVRPRNIEDIAAAMEKIINMSSQQRAEMGARGRLKMEAEFDREVVVNAYMNEIYKVLCP